MRDNDNELDLLELTGPAFPLAVQIAGWIWFVIGSLTLLTNILGLIVAAGQGGGSSFFGAFIGGVFCHVGLQSVQGKAKGTLGNGIGSLLFGLLQAGVGILLVVGDPFFAGQDGLVAGIAGGIAIFGGIGLVAAGILALVGRERYKAWRRAQKVTGNSVRS